LIEKSDYVEVYTRHKVYKSKFVIVAEGSTGKLKYLVRRKDKKDEFGFSVVTEIERENEIIDNYIYNAIDIHFGIANMGYGWIFPHEKYFSVGVGGIAVDFLTPQRTMREFLNDNGFKGNFELKTHIVPMGGIKRKLLTSRIVLSGDAAGFVDSFTGEGLAYAIRSGQIAVEVIYKILSLKSPLNSLVDYESLCDKEFGNNLKYSLMLSRLMHRYPKIFFRIFTNNDQPLDKFLEVSAVKTSYKAFIKWLIPRIPIFLWNT
jgi:flavin-dependent dehydrogenase